MLLGGPDETVPGTEQSVQELPGIFIIVVSVGSKDVCASLGSGHVHLRSGLWGRAGVDKVASSR